MIEQDPIARKHAIGLAVVNDDPVRVKLRAAIRRARIERRGLTLGRLDDLTVQLGCGRLVEFDMLFKTAGADSVEKAKGTEPVDVASVFGHLERDFDM